MFNINFIYKKDLKERYNNYILANFTKSENWGNLIISVLIKSLFDNHYIVFYSKSKNSNNLSEF